MNVLTRFLNSASTILFLGHPTRTALGFLLGVSVKIVLKLLGARINPAFDIPNVEDWELGILGMVILHLPTIRYYMLRRGGLLSEEEEKIFTSIRELKIAEYDKQVLYTKLIEKFIDKIELKAETQNEIAEVRLTQEELNNIIRRRNR